MPKHKTPKRYHVIIEEGEFDSLYSIKPNEGDPSLCWDEEWKSTAQAVCRAMNKAYERGKCAKVKK